MSRTVIDELGTQLRDLFPDLRLHCLSLHDSSGDPVWLNEGALGPDEHGLVMDALDGFELETTRRCYERPLGNGHTALLFALRDASGHRCGVVLLISDSRTVDGRGDAKALDPAVQLLLEQISRLFAAKTAAATVDPDAGAATLIAPSLGDADLTRVAAPAPITLYVQQLLKLRTSGRTRRYEVLLRAGTGEHAPVDLLRLADEDEGRGLLDRQIVTQLITWLTQNREQIEAEPASFSVNLSRSALLDPEFPPFVARALRAARLNPRILAFEIREQLCRQQLRETERFVRACEQMTCQVVIDDFTLHSDVLPLLRSSAVRLVKIDAQLTAAAMKDKLSQAIVVAISQASKVLGTHCVAKRIDSAMARQWLAAVGVDFAQGFLLEGPLPLTDLVTLASKPQVQQV
jgi:EAL domain-containing protein (putative c-di-GMP-specific phosphodiesterase class I)